MTTWLARVAPLAAFALTLPMPLLAQNAPPPAGYGARGSAQGGQSVQEMMAKMRSRLGRADANRDNRISLAEWNARGKQGAQGKDHSRQFNKIDANRDGYVSVPELNAFIQARVAKMDRNHDGFISQDEHGKGGKGGGKGGKGGDKADRGARDDDQY